MCGILGCSFKNDNVDSQILRLAISQLNHRGPDSNGIYISDDAKVGFGHTRLSFLDLTEAGNQPMSNENHQIAVTLNGEIYNYIELREELSKLGYKFRTQTDTEVLIHGYNEWGEELPSKLDGMFALAIYDHPGKKIFMARDRFGIKPLYYFHDKEKFLFGSEIKAIIAFNKIPLKVNPKAVSLFLSNRYIPSPDTIWEGIKKVKPGFSVTLNLPKFNITEEEYWRLPVGNKKIDPNEASEIFASKLLNSLNKHLRSEVPIGSFLSGGYDSSTLVHLMSKELNRQTEAFSIGFKNWEESEDQYAKMVAEATNASLFTAIPDAIKLESVKNLMWHYDEPIADISIIPTFEVSRLASQNVKAVLSGEGADEMLAGYWWHKPEQFLYKNKWREFRSTFSKPTFEDVKHHYVNAMSMGLFDTKELQRAVGPEFLPEVPADPFAHFYQFKLNDAPTIKQLQYLDVYNFMSELVLTKIDRASMAHSLEVRVPFLDHHLLEFVFSLSPDTYIKLGVQKPFLRNILKGNVPDQILNRTKQGFVGPDSYYMDYKIYESTLLNGRLIQENVIKQSYVKEKLREKDHWRLWKLFVLENWWQVWV